MTNTKELIVLYEVHEYKGDALLCQYSSEYPKDLKAKVNQNLFIIKKEILQIKKKYKDPRQASDLCVLFYLTFDPRGVVSGRKITFTSSSPEARIIPKLSRPKITAGFRFLTTTTL